MTRDELLNHLRRELSNQAWSELRPDSRLGELEANIDALAERIEKLRATYNDTTDQEPLRALDDLGASLSYLRIEIGHLFSDTTRLANEIRAAVRRIDGDEAEQVSLQVDDAETAADGSEPETDATEGDSDPQTSLF